MSEQTDTVQVLNGNIIQIKRGTGTPNGKLAPYELGISTDDNTLYIGGALELVQGESEGSDKYTYGAARSIRVEYANKATNSTNSTNSVNAKKMVNSELNALNVGSSNTPVYFSNGIPVICTEMLSSTGGSINGNLTINGTLTVSNSKTTVGTLSIQGPLLGSTYSCGTSFPSNPVEGQLFFKIVG